MLWNKIIPSIDPALIYGIGAVGLALPLRFLRNPDFTSLASIVLGAMVAARVWQPGCIGTLFSLFAGMMTGAILGCITALLTRKVDLILAGIIVYTGSLTPAFMLGDGGAVSLSGWSIHTAPLDSQASFSNFTILGLIGIALCVFLGKALQTKWGSLVNALVADHGLLTCRHKYRHIVTCGVLVTSNAVIALAGSLSALRNNSAAVDSFKDFLPYALGAFFAGEAFVQLLGEKMAFGHTHERLPPKVEVSNWHHTKPGEKTPSYFRSIFSRQRDETMRFPWLLFSYLTAAFGMYCIAALARSGELIEGIQLSENFEHLVAAILIYFAVRLGSKKEA